MMYDDSTKRLTNQTSQEHVANDDEPSLAKRNDERNNRKLQFIDIKFEPRR
jgi:hypothetical protein